MIAAFNLATNDVADGGRPPNELTYQKKCKRRAPGRPTTVFVCAWVKDRLAVPRSRGAAHARPPSAVHKFLKI
jgi:hypothetical protein